jgi:hypothetical protein
VVMNGQKTMTGSSFSRRSTTARMAATVVAQRTSQRRALSAGVAAGTDQDEGDRRVGRPRPGRGTTPERPAREG